MDNPTTSSDQHYVNNDLFPPVSVSKETELLIESEKPDKIQAYLLRTVDVMRQQISMLIHVVSDVYRESKKTNGKVIKLQEWKEEYEDILPDAIIAVNKHERSIEEHKTILNDINEKVEVHNTLMTKTSTISDFIVKVGVFVGATIATVAALVEIFK
jgi:hypothetical protein